MGKSKTLILPDLESLVKAAAIYFSVAVKEAIQERGRFLAALSSGDEAAFLFYETLGKPPYRDYIPWDKVHIFWCDEKCVPPDDEENNYYQAWQNWLKHVVIPTENIHRIQSELEKEEAIKNYINELQLFAEIADKPIFDFVLLSLGTFGQVASLYPGYDPELVARNLVYSIHYPQNTKLADRIALSPLLINHSRQVVITANGSNKTEALVSTIKGDRDKKRWPAQLIDPINGLLVWMVDAAAAKDHLV
jgi:6-phosphogluconolactonase